MVSRARNKSWAQEHFKGVREPDDAVVHAGARLRGGKTLRRDRRPRRLLLRDHAGRSVRATAGEHVGLHRPRRRGRCFGRRTRRSVGLGNLRSRRTTSRRGASPRRSPDRPRGGHRRSVHGTGDAEPARRLRDVLRGAGPRRPTSTPARMPASARAGASRSPTTRRYRCVWRTCASTRGPPA